MNKREARKLAHGICSSLLQNFIDVGACLDWANGNDADAARLEKVIDEMAQREFDLGGGMARHVP